MPEKIDFLNEKNIKLNYSFQLIFYFRERPHLNFLFFFLFFIFLRKASPKLVLLNPKICLSGQWFLIKDQWKWNSKHNK